MSIRLSCLIIFFLLGIKSTMAQTGVRNDAGLQGDAGAVSGFFETESPVNYPSGATSWWHLLDVRHSNQGNNYAMQMAGSFFDQNFYLRKTNGNGQQPWQRIVTESNGVISLPNLNIQTPGGQSFFIGRQMGNSYSYGDGIFRALTDNPNGAQNFYFDGLTAGNRLFSVRADGQGYFAGNLGVGMPTPMAKLHIRKIDAFSDANASGSTIDNLLLIQAPYTGSDPSSMNGAGYKWGIQLWGRNDVGQLSGDKSVGIYAVSEDPGLGFNRSVGLALHTSPFDQANREVARITSNGFLGLGTANPRQKFDLWGGKMTITGEDHNGTALITSAGGVAYFGNDFYDNGLAVSSNGKIGIGTSFPEGKLHLNYDGTALNGANPTFGGSGLIVQAATGGRFSDKGAQIEFVIPANSDGSNFYGQGRIITVAGNLQNSNAAGKMILGTRRLFDKYGNGLNWFYGDDIVIDGTGNVGINVSNPSEKLTVNGTVKAREIRVDGQGAPDYVFEETYHKLSLAEVEKYIRLNKHLPEVPSAKEFERDGMAVGEMNKILLKKIEELTLHLIEHERKMNEQAEVLARQQKEISELKGKIK
jgi:hypothetical protein